VRVEAEPQAFGKIAGWEYALRFAFGGTITACTGLVAHVFGPVVAGLFLAFPAILPATVTLVTRHDGRNAASADARGAAAGSVGLGAFALYVWGLSTRWTPALVLAVATVCGWWSPWRPGR
jgi:Protein of unknown function (DUF3147)